MKLSKLSLAGACALIALGMTALAGCSSKDEPVDNGSSSQYDDAYYAALATVGSDSSDFTATAEGGTVTFAAEGGTVVIRVDCGTEWAMVNHAADLFDAVADVSAGTLTVSAGQSLVEQEQSATITLRTAANHINFATVTVVQEAYGAAHISVEPSRVNFPAAVDLVAEVAVTSSFGTWEVDNPLEWVSVENVEGGVVLTAEVNPEAETRSGEITLTSTDGLSSASAVIKVSQAASASITFSSESFIFFDEGQTGTLTVQATGGSWDYSYDESNGWFTVGRDGNVITVTVTAANDGEADIESSILFTTPNGEGAVLEVPFTVVLAAPDENSLVLEYSIPSGGADIRLPLFGTVDCTIYWGDGTWAGGVTTAMPSHSYTAKGTVAVKVSGTSTMLNSQGITLNGPDTYLTAVRQWGRLGYTQLDYAFYYCSGLTSIPDDTVGSFADVTSFFYAFWGASLTKIPDGLFAYAAKAENFCGVFAKDAAIKTIPDGLFDACTEAKDFSHAFRELEYVSSIPTDLFKYNTKAETFDLAFYFCTGITSIPAALFSTCTEATSFYGTFECCISVTTIPADLFKYNTKVTDFRAVFYFMSAIRTVPEDIFAYCPDVTTFQSCFGYCSNLTTVPAGLFRNNTKVENFFLAFSNCKSLTSVPAALFANCPEVTSFYCAFESCAKLASIPEGLFSACTKVETFSYCFEDCTALAGESAYDVVDGTKIHLYERSKHTDLYTTPSGTWCYHNCTGLSDYSSISSGWK